MDHLVRQSLFVSGAGVNQSVGSFNPAHPQSEAKWTTGLSDPMSQCKAKWATGPLDLANSQFETKRTTGSFDPAYL